MEAPAYTSISAGTWRPRRLPSACLRIRLALIVIRRHRRNTLGLDLRREQMRTIGFVGHQASAVERRARANTVGQARRRSSQPAVRPCSNLGFRSSLPYSLLSAHRGRQRKRSHPSPALPGAFTEAISGRSFAMSAGSWKLKLEASVKELWPRDRKDSAPARNILLAAIRLPISRIEGRKPNASAKSGRPDGNRSSGE